MAPIYRVIITSKNNKFETMCTSLRAVYEALSDFVTTFNIDIQLDDLFESIVFFSRNEFVANHTSWYCVAKVTKSDNAYTGEEDAEDERIHKRS